MSSVKPHRRPPLLTLLSLLIAGTLGLFILQGKGQAQAPSPVGPGVKVIARPKLPASVAASASAAPAAPASSGGGDEGDRADKGDKKGKKGDDKRGKKDDKGDYEDPESYAVVGPKGGVPVHEGRFKSPFAHPHWAAPTKIRVGLLLDSVRDYDIKEGTFEADFFLSLTSETTMPPMEIIFANGKKDPDNSDVITDLPTFKLYRFNGTFSSVPDLRLYPFDTQDLSIELEDHNSGTDQVQFEADEAHTNLGVGFAVTGWGVSYLRARAIDFYYPDRFDNDDLYYSRYKLSLGLRRFGTSAAFTVFVPAIVIVLISLSGLWLPKEELEVRSNASAPMLAAAVLFHFSLMQALPPTSYLTRADKVMMGVYISLVLNMLATWLWFVLDEKHTDLVFKLGKWVIPPVTVILFAMGSLL
jgi:hypothetical protein